MSELELSDLNEEAREAAEKAYRAFLYGDEIEFNGDLTLGEKLETIQNLKRRRDQDLRSRDIKLQTNQPKSPDVGMMPPQATDLMEMNIKTPEEAREAIESYKRYQDLIERRADRDLEPRERILENLGRKHGYKKSNGNLICPMCGDGDYGNKSGSTPWCFKCDAPLLSESECEAFREKRRKKFERDHFGHTFKRFKGVTRRK